MNLHIAPPASQDADDITVPVVTDTVVTPVTVPNTTAGDPASIDAEHLARLPALSAYLNRVNARPKNFSKYVVEPEGAPTYGNLRSELARIKIVGGKIECSSEDYKPTEAEVADIEAEVAVEIAAHRWPTSTAASEAAVNNLVIKLRCKRSDLFVFRKQVASQNAEVLFVQQRVKKPNGTKDDLPWSFWNDGQWRCMEPDGLLPIFGLDELHSGKPLMLHEGAKTAQYVQWLTSDAAEAQSALAQHPWGAELKHFAHLGWPGGAINAHRVDWVPIKKLSLATRVVLACDNDDVGKAAATKISKILMRAMEVIMLDGRFPVGFDLADPFPDKLFRTVDRRTIYKGPTLKECSRCGTWATQQIPNPNGRGAPTYKLRDAFVAENRFINDPQLFISLKNDQQIYTTETFNRTVQPFSDVKDTAALLLHHVEAQATGITYDPGLPSGLVNVEGASRINSYRPPAIKAKQGSVRPFLKFMFRLIPIKKDRRELLRWCATLIACPEVRVKYGVLMMSETQGVGKSTLMEKIMGPLVGWHNVSVPNEKQVTESEFNAWLAQRRLVLVHEIYAGQSKRAYNNIKSAMTDDRLTVNEKYRPTYEVKNWAHFMAASNSPKALHMAAEDRRWLVPKVTDKKQTPEYWMHLNEWLSNGGLEYIYHWASTYVAKYGAVRAGDDAPLTSTKLDLIEESLSEGQKLVRDMADMVAGSCTQVAFTDRMAREWLAGQLGVPLSFNKLEGLGTVRKMLAAGGLIHVGHRKVRGRRDHIYANYAGAALGVPLTDVAAVVPRGAFGSGGVVM